jgi:hypothetical protein
MYVFSNTFSTLFTMWNTLFMPCTPVKLAYEKFKLMIISRVPRKLIFFEKLETGKA